MDEPYLDTGLKIYYSSLPEEDGNKKWPLLNWYSECGIDIKKVARFAEQLGCSKEFHKLYGGTDCAQNPNWKYLARAPGYRAGNVVNRDFALTPEAARLLKLCQQEAALLIWQALARSETVRPTILKARFQWTDKGGPHESDSQFVCDLKALAWVPQTDGSFVKPSEATALKMPKGFVVDTGYKWMEAVGFGTEAQKQEVESIARAESRKSIGFKTEEALQRALAFADLPEDDQERFLEKSRQRVEIELPEKEVRHPELRKERVAEQARETPEKSSELRTRKVQIGEADAKVEAKIYLKDQYTNSSRQMFCQACQKELPFKLPSGGYYFEAVEVVNGSAKRLREVFLALCPNHAAAYQYANAQRDEMQELITVASGREVELELGGKETTLYFTDAHLADIRACWNADESSEEDAA